MKSIKTAIVAIATLASTIAFGGGLYIVANSDFNMPSLVFKMNVTTTSEPTPLFSAQLSGVMVRIDDGTVLTNVVNQQLEYTFNTTGIHTIKAYAMNPRTLFDFQENQNLTQILPLRDVQVGRYAQLELLPNCQNCRNLTDVAFPVLVTETRSWYSFRYCHGLTNVVFNKNIKVITQETFRYCGNLPKIDIPDSVIDIGTYAFQFCTNLTQVTIGNSVTNIGASAIQTCPNLLELTIPDSVTVIGRQAFQNNAKMTNVVIGSGLKEIQFGVFSNCPRLERVVLGNNITNIGEKAFLNTGKLKSLSIPESVTVIGPNAFGSAGLTTLSMPSMTVQQVTDNCSTWAIKSGCVVTCSDGTYTIP